MRNLQRVILVLGDGNSGRVAVERAFETAERFGGKVTVMSVINDQSMGAFIGRPPLEREELLTALAEDRLERVHNLVEGVLGRRLEESPLIAFGTPVVEVIRAVRKLSADLVVKPALGMDGPVRSMLFGSLAMHLMRKCPCPVWVVKDSENQILRCINVAVSAAPIGTAEGALEVELLQVANSLSARDRAELHVTTAWGVHGEHTMRVSPRLRYTEDAVDELVKQTEIACRNNLQAQLREAQIDSSQVTLHLEKGAAEEVVPHVAQLTRADLVVMGSLGRTGIAGLLIGNTAESILNQIQCSVLTLKPESFVSPIT